jgi:hypothetical protein
MPRRRRAPYDFLAPLNPKQRAKQAKQYVNAQYGPVLANLNADYARQARVGANTIASTTNQLATQLAPEAAHTHDIYAGAQSAQAALDAAIAAKLTGAGASLGQDVSGQLAAAGQSTAPASNLTALGAGAGAASYGIGSAALSGLIGRGAAAETAAAALPGIARLGGAQRGADFLGQVESGRQKDVSALRSKIPGTLADIQQQQDALEFQKSAARIGFQGDILSANARAAATQESARSHDLSYKARMAAIKAANTRTGMTLKERADYHNRSLQQQAHHDKIAADQRNQGLKQDRRKQFISEQYLKYKRNHPTASGSDINSFIAGLKKKK